MPKGSKKRASAPNFVSNSQLVLMGFEIPFSQKLSRDNRWIVLAGKIPWDEVCNIITNRSVQSDSDLLNNPAPLFELRVLDDKSTP